MTCLENQSDLEALAAHVMGSSMGSYERVRVLPDGSVAAIGRLMFTKALFLGCSRIGFESRFCFDNFSLADQRFDELQSEDDLPKGYIARRGYIQPAHVEYEIERLHLIGSHGDAAVLEEHYAALKAKARKSK